MPTDSHPSVTYTSFTMDNELAVIDLWNRTLTKDPVDIARFHRKVLYTPAFDPRRLVLAVLDDEVVGFAYGVADTSDRKAWLIALGVDARVRRRGIGTGLLDRLAAASDDAIDTVIVGAYPAGYFFPGVDHEAYPDAVPFLETRGYASHGTSVAMRMDLRDYAVPARYREREEAFAAQGIRLRTYREDDYLKVMEGVRRDFPYWVPEMRPSLVTGDATRTLHLAVDAEDELLGFALTGMEGDPGRFGPFGVRPEVRGRGIGALLFHRAMEALRRARAESAFCLWTGGENEARYTHWGMTVSRTFTMMRKEHI